MRLGILSRNRSLYSTSRLVRAAEARGHRVEVLDYLQCFMKISASGPELIYEGRPCRPDGVIPRIGASHTFYGTTVVRHLEMMGVPVANRSLPILQARDKLWSLQLLAGSGVPMPVTAFAHSPKEIHSLIDTVGGAPLILKLLQGTHGMGVVLAETRKAAESVISAFRQINADILVQEFLAEAKGADIRCFVVGGRVIASMRRQGPPGEFRSNFHRGGSVSPVEITPAERRVVLQAIDVLGLDVAGVDFIRSLDGPKILEVNASPGFEGIETATRVDVATIIIRQIERLVASAQETPHG